MRPYMIDYKPANNYGKQPGFYLAYPKKIKCYTEKNDRTLTKRRRPKVKVREKKNECYQIPVKNRMLKLDLLPAKNVEENITKEAKKRKQRHDCLIAETQILDEWETNKFNKRSAGTVVVEPIVSSEMIQDLKVICKGIRRIE
jgi:hypothetical protein